MNAAAAHNENELPDTKELETAASGWGSRYKRRCVQHPMNLVRADGKLQTS